MGDVRATLDVSQEPGATFAALLDELGLALARRGLRFEAAPTGRVRQGDDEVGRVLAWEPGRRALLEWLATPWADAAPAQLELRAEPGAGGARLSLELRGWDQVAGDVGDLVGWFASELAAPLLAAASPAAVGDWITDRRARRPSGPGARATYREPLYHYPNFRVILAELALAPEDELVEVACGGGAFLKLALESGCRAAAVDHSEDMVRTARELNGDAIAAGRLDIRLASAEALPFPDGRFSCAVMTGVFGFLADPVAALRELRRVLRPGGRLVAMGTDPAWRGTPAAPEPMASRLHFWNDGELERLARAAGFGDVRVERREMLSHARAVGVPDEALPLFAGPGAPFILARNV